MFSIIIVNYNGMSYLPGCLGAVRAQTYRRGVEIVAVNNLSTDGSREYLLAQEDVRLIDPGMNTGFSRGQNLGIRASRGEYVLCLNFDCLLEPGFLERVGEVFDARSEIGAVSGKLRKLIDHTKTKLIDSTGISFARCQPADRGEWSSDQPLWDEEGPIFGPSGAAACYRRSALEDVRFGEEYFDEDMFIYCEDIDLAWRLNLRGWKSWYTPSALAYHERGSTRKESPQERRNYLLMGSRNRYIGLYKNLRYGQDVRPNWTKILRHEVLAVMSLARRDLASARIAFAAILGAVSKTFFCRRMREKRSFIQTRLGNDGAFFLNFQQ